MPFGQLSGMSDNALLVAYANGTPQAAQILTERLMPKIFAQAFHRLRNKADAEDIAQEALRRLWRITPVGSRVIPKFQRGSIKLSQTCALIAYVANNPRIWMQFQSLLTRDRMQPM